MRPRAAVTAGGMARKRGLSCSTTLPRGGDPTGPTSTVMFSHGRTIAADHLVALVSDAVEHSAATMTRDAGTRMPAEWLATQQEIDQRIAAALLGAAEAFACGAWMHGSG